MAAKLRNHQLLSASSLLLVYALLADTHRGYLTNLANEASAMREFVSSRGYDLSCDEAKHAIKGELHLPPPDH